MFQWLSNITLYTATPERLAERALNEVRLELFRAEQKVLDAQLYANYYRDRLRFLEQVGTEGIEHVADQRAARQGVQGGLRVPPKLASNQ